MARKQKSKARREREKIAVKKRKDSHQLAQLIQKLPQELYDTILDLTLTSTYPICVEIDRRYAPPPALYLNRRSKADFATTFHGNSDFYASNINMLAKWLLSLSDAHLDLLQHITHRRQSQHALHTALDYGQSTVSITTTDPDRASLVAGLLVQGVAKRIADGVKIAYGSKLAHEGPES